MQYYSLVNPRRDGIVIGFLGGEPIYDVVFDRDDNRYRYCGVVSRNTSGSIAVDTLCQGEWLVDNKLIYAVDNLRK